MKQTSARLDKTPPSFVPARAVWTLVLNSQLAAPPAYDDTHAYFALEGNRIVAYTLPEGTLTWTVSAHPMLPPTAGDGLLFVVEGHALAARRGADGSVAWQLPLEDPLAAPPAYENGWLVVATQGGKIAALRADTGGIVWQRDIGSPAHTRPTLFDDRVYVPANDGRIVALKIESGEPVWERRLGGAPAEILSLGERMYVGTSDNFFYCLIAKDGTVDWRWRTGGDVVGQPVADERYVFFVALDNLLRAMDRKTGAQVWVRPLPVRPIAGALLAGSTLLVAGLPAQLRAFNAKDGTPAAGEPIVPGARGPATAAIKTVYVPGLDIPLRPIADTDLAASVPSKIPTEVEIPSGSATAPSKIANIANDAETAAPPHLILDPETKLPMVLMLTRDVARGAGVTLLTRDFDPAVAPLSPLPNMVMIAPQTPQTQRR